MNAIGKPLIGKVVKLHKTAIKTDPAKALFLCHEGFGCNPAADGRGIFGVFLSDGEHCAIAGEWIEKLATSTEIEKAVVASFDPALVREWLSRAGAIEPKCACYPADYGTNPKCPVKDAAHSPRSDQPLAKLQKGDDK